MSQQTAKRKNGLSSWDDLDSPCEDARAQQSAELLQRADGLITTIVGRLRRKSKDDEDYRQDVLLSLLAKFIASKNDPTVDPIEKYDAYVAQSSFNQLKPKYDASVDLQKAQSLDDNKHSYKTLADPLPSQAVTFSMGELIKQAWRECVALMSTEQLTVLLFDRNDILWQLICMRDPINLDEIALALGLTPFELQQILNRLPCKNDRDLAHLMGVNQKKVHNLRIRMKPLLKRIESACGYTGEWRT